MQDRPRDGMACLDWVPTLCLKVPNSVGQALRVLLMERLLGRILIKHKEAVEIQSHENLINDKDHLISDLYFSF